MSEHRRTLSDRGKRLIQRILGVVLSLVGLGIAAVPIVLELQAGRPLDIGATGRVLIGVGVFYFLFGQLLSRLPFVFAKLSLVLIFLPCCLGVVEFVGRVTSFDFARTQRGWSETPICFRQPTVPLGDAFFRRSGPDRWKGKVLTTQLRRIGVQPSNAYPNEPVLTIEYDRDGFRNSVDLQRWDLVFVGDSFVELGHLADSDMYSSMVGAGLNRPVKNLGVADTGTLSHCAYLRGYGNHNQLNDVVLVFFEGNDGEDTLREYEALMMVRQGEERPQRDLATQRQTSFFRALASVFQQNQFDAINAAFVAANQPPVDLTVTYTPKSQDDMSDREAHAIEYALQEYTDTARRMNARPWLVYMPCKRRVLDGHLDFVPDAPSRFVNWKPTNLPRWIQKVCEANRIRFIDVTSDLVERTEKGELVFNHVYDTHLNALGSSIVAESIMGAMKNETEIISDTTK